MERENFKEQLGQFLHDIRMNRGFSKAELSKMTGVTVRAIDYWESGQRNVLLEHLIQALIAMGFEVEIAIKEKGGNASDKSGYKIRY